jgi:hypothetical protein
MPFCTLEIRCVFTGAQRVQHEPAMKSATSEALPMSSKPCTVADTGWLFSSIFHRQLRLHRVRLLQAKTSVPARLWVKFACSPHGAQLIALCSVLLPVYTIRELHKQRPWQQRCCQHQQWAPGPEQQQRPLLQPGWLPHGQHQQQRQPCTPAQQQRHAPAQQ